MASGNLPSPSHASTLVVAFSPIAAHSRAQPLRFIGFLESFKQISDEARPTCSSPRNGEDRVHALFPWRTDHCQPLLPVFGLPHVVGNDRHSVSFSQHGHNLFQLLKMVDAGSVLGDSSKYRIEPFSEHIVGFIVGDKRVSSVIFQVFRIRQFFLKFIGVD